jgi:polysaccharide biosynthesis protein PslJ
VTTNRGATTTALATVVILAIVLPSAWAAMSYGKLGLLGVVGAYAVIVAVYVGIRHPLWFFWGLAFVLGALPFGRVPGVGVPLWQPLTFGAVVAMFFHPKLRRPAHPLEFAIWALFFTSMLSVIVTGQSFADISIFVRWGMATLLMLALARLSAEHAVRFGKILVVTSAVNGAYGLYVIAFDPGYSSLLPLRAFGYIKEALFSRVAYAGESVATTNRLGGTWVEPNGAGLNLALALVLAVLLFAGWQRLVLLAVISVALVLTLSRASIFTVIAGVLMVLAFHPMAAKARGALLGFFGIAVIVALSIEPIRRRFLTSFGSGDAGSAARADALEVFPGQMAGHWVFGWGWARREFIDPAYSYTFNLPSNAPLVTLYRGGGLAFIAFMVLAIMGCVYAYRAVRCRSFPLALYGGSFIGLVVVQMQLDHPLAGTPTGALTYSIFLGFLVYVDRARRELSRPPTDPAVPSVATTRVTDPIAT